MPDQDLTALAFAAARGDRDALTDLIRATQRDVLRFLKPLTDAADVEDLAQETFLRAVRALPEFAGRSSVRTWLFAIARRVAQAHRRRASRNAASPVEPLSDQLSDELADERPGGGDPFAELSRAQAAATVLAILEQLDDDKRMVFALVELEQLPVPEVARMLDLNLNTAYSRLRLARQAFEAAVKARQTR